MLVTIFLTSILIGFALTYPGKDVRAMPLEMFVGKTGSRLIARLPVESGSYAVISTDTIDRMAVHHIPGLVKDGYPALSPALASLPDPIKSPVEKRRQELRALCDDRLEKLDRASTRLLCTSTADVTEAIYRGLHQAMFDLERTMVMHFRPGIDKPIVCTSIMVGRRLQLRLLKGVFEELSVIDAGIVESIDIFNAPPR